MDAIVYLMENGIAAEKISWVISRDSWVIDRATTQNTEAFFERSIGNQANQFEALAEATSIEDLFHRLEDKGAYAIGQKTYPYTIPRRNGKQKGMGTSSKSRDVYP